MKHSYAEYALLFKALSDETRLKILNMVSDAPLCACNILEEFNITQPTLSYHMKILSACELVIGEKKGSWMFYTLNKEKSMQMIDLLNEIISKKENVIMNSIEIFDPAMCCETGVCGPGIDPELMRVATTLSSLKEKGIQIKRHGLSNDPQAFVSNKVINDILQKEGADVLPVTLLNGEVAKTKTYPTSEEFSKWLGVEVTVVESNEASCDCENGCC